jgi:addiction module HigA family antidote
MDKKLHPVHPGEVLEEEFLKPLNVSRYALAKALHVSATRIGEIVAGSREITAETALLLSKCFGTSAEFWLNLQAQYNLEIAEQKLHNKIEAVQRLRAAA